MEIRPPRVRDARARYLRQPRKRAIGFTAARGSEADEIKLLREQIQLLDQKLQVLEQKQEQRDEAEAAAKKAAVAAPKPVTMPIVRMPSWAPKTTSRTLRWRSSSRRCGISGMRGLTVRQPGVSTTTG